MHPGQVPQGTWTPFMPSDSCAMIRPVYNHIQEMVMSTTSQGTCRHFVTYSGVKLPFKLVNELGDNELGNRNTYFRGYFDADGRLSGFDKLVYGEIELSHRYTYHDNGKLLRAEITDADEELTVLDFDEAGQPA